MDAALFKTFGEALGIGFLIGVERYRDRKPDERRSAGVRTFSVISLLGAVTAQVGSAPAALITFSGIAVLLTVGYYRHSAVSSGLTTEISALLTFWLGYLADTHEALAISSGIVVALLLAHKRTLHDFIKQRLTEQEFYDTLKFLVVVFVVLPLLPDRGIGPYGFLNPANIWMLVILVSAIEYLGYVMSRIMGTKRGLNTSAIVGGLVSTTAVTASLAERSRETPETSRLLGVVGVAANAMQFPRLLVLVWAVDAGLGRFVTIPLAGMFLAGLLGVRLISRRAETEPAAVWPRPEHQNPFALWPALKFGLLFIVILFVAKVATVQLGSNGLYLTSGLAGLGDASAISLSAAKLVAQNTVSSHTGGLAVLIAASMNALFKAALALWTGSRAFAFWLSGGLGTMVAVGALLMAAQMWPLF